MLPRFRGILTAMSVVDQIAVDAEQERIQAEQLVSAIPLIPEVQRIDVELYTDNTGDPSFQLVFHIRPKVRMDQKFIRKFNQFAGLVQTSILHSDLRRFPYTRLKRAA